MKLILSLDTCDAQHAAQVFSVVKNDISHVKLGHIPFAIGMDAIKELIGDTPLFLDFKMYDIPTTMARAITGYLDAFINLQMFTIWGHSQDAALQASVEACGDRCQALSVVSLSSVAADESQFLRIVERNLNNGITGFITPSVMVAKMRQAFGDDVTLVTPGVRLSQDDDHANVLTPTQAKAQGCDYIVVGRPIMNAENVPAALSQFTV